MKKLAIVLALGSTLFYSCQATQASCPSEGKVKENLSKLINRDFKIEALTPSKNMQGLCEVVVRVGLRPVVLYTDGKGENYIAGNMFNASTKENLTQTTASKYMKVSQEVLQKLEGLVNMTYGKGEKFVYYITDPDCPFCRRFSPMLKDWADKNKVTVKVILYPLPIHPQAKPKSIAMVCDKLGYDHIHKDVNTKNQCEKGKKAIEENLKFLQEIGISGTPTVIGMNGKYIVGLPRNPDDLKTLVE